MQLAERTQKYNQKYKETTALQNNLETKLKGLEEELPKVIHQLKKTNKKNTESWRLRSSHGRNLSPVLCHYLGVSGGREFAQVALKNHKKSEKAQGTLHMRIRALQSPYVAHMFFLRSDNIVDPMSDRTGSWSLGPIPGSLSLGPSPRVRVLGS